MPPPPGQCLRVLCDLLLKIFAAAATSTAEIFAGGLMVTREESLAEIAKSAEGGLAGTRCSSDSCVFLSVFLVGVFISVSFMQFTSEQRTRSSAWLRTSIVGWVMVLSLVVILSDSVPGWLCVTLIIASCLLLA